MKRIICSIALLMSALNATAGSVKNWDVEYDQCVDKTIKANHLPGINNGVVEACASSVSESAKKEINRLYKKFYDQLIAESADDARAFETAQKSWLSYRNLHCELAGQYVGSPMYAYCPMALNIERVKELQELVGEK